MDDSDPSDSEIDFLTDDEYQQLQTAVLQYEGIDRDQFSDEQLRFATLFHVGFDAGLTPDEVAQASPEWFNTNTNRVTVPSRDQKWPTLHPRSWEFVTDWLEERKNRQRYKSTDAMWLTDSGNRYDADLLDEHIAQLCTEAGITLDDRTPSWNLLRNTVGVFIAGIEGVGMKGVKHQLDYADEGEAEKFAPFAALEVPIEVHQRVHDKIG